MNAETMEQYFTKNAKAYGRVVAINRSGGGVPKLQVEEALITGSGVEGDRQRNLKLHGGPDRAVVLYSMENIQALVAEGHTITPGSVGENLTLEGIDWSLMTLGAELQIGPVRLQITKYAIPCQNLKDLF